MTAVPASFPQSRAPCRPLFPMSLCAEKPPALTPTTRIQDAEAREGGEGTSGRDKVGGRKGAEDGGYEPVGLPLGQLRFSPLVPTVNLSLPSLASSHVPNTGNTGF